MLCLREGVRDAMEGLVFTVFTLLLPLLLRVLNYLQARLLDCQALLLKV